MNKLPFERIKRKILVKKETKTSERYGCKPEERSIKELINYGIINLNKPPGPTSHQVSDHVKKILNIKKAGHSGTLDPKVTGVLPIALGRATRITQTLLKAGKEYVALMYLHKKVPKNKIGEVAKQFTGEIKQIPPIRSAVKRQERVREIYYLNILEVEDKNVLFKIGCEAGTYIRKIAHDWGQALGTGAHMKQLIRTRAGPFNDKNWYSLHDLKDAFEFYKEGDERGLKKIILPIESAVEYLPKMWVFDSAVDNLCHGSSLYVMGISKLNDQIKKDDLVAVFTLKNELICLGKSMLDSEELLKKEKGLAIKTRKVFMETGTYSDVKNKGGKI